jgi:hypothetical protein
MSNYERALEWQDREEIYRRRAFLVSRNEAQEMLVARKAAVRKANIVDLAQIAIAGVVQMEKKVKAAIREEPDAEFAARNIQAVVNMGLSQTLYEYWNRP